MLVLWASVVGACRWGYQWFDALGYRGLRRHSAAKWLRVVLRWLPSALLVGLFWLLGHGAAQEVRGDLGYLVLFTALGGVWLHGAIRASAWLGVHLAEDVVDRDNVAAGFALVGAELGGMATYGFANLGEGDSIWMTIAPALLAAAAVFALAWLHQTLSGAAEAIAVERDVASGLRFGGLMLGLGLVVGRTMAGDYTSMWRAVRDLGSQGWPALLLVWAAAVLQRAWRPTRQWLTPSPWRYGVLPALGYVALGVACMVGYGVEGAWGPW